MNRSLQSLKKRMGLLSLGLALYLGVSVVSEQALAQTKGPIRIGVLAPITGPLATPGAEMLNGLKMYWEQNAYTAGGRKIELVVADTTCNPDQALTQARRLITDCP